MRGGRRRVKGNRWSGGGALNQLTNPSAYSFNQIRMLLCSRRIKRPTSNTLKLLHYRANDGFQSSLVSISIYNEHDRERKKTFVPKARCATKSFRYTLHLRYVRNIGEDNSYNDITLSLIPCNLSRLFQISLANF